MKFLKLLLISLVPLCLCGLMPASEKQVPEFTFISKDGDTLSSKNLQDRLVYVYFWASWNPDCRKRHADLVNMYEQYRVKLQKSKMRFDVVAVSIDEQPDNWQLAIKQDDLHWAYNYCDLQGWNGKYIEAFGVKRVPQSFLISNGEIAGRDLFDKKLEQALDSLLVSN